MNNPESFSQSGEISQNEWEKVMEKMAQQNVAEDGTQPARAPGYEYLSEEAMSEHETNLNSKTGKERTFSDMDLYAINSYESVKEQGEDRKDRNDHTVWAELIPYEIGRDETSEEARKRYSDLINEKLAEYPRGENESLSSYRQRVKEIVSAQDQNQEVNHEENDYDAKFKDFAERLEHQVERYESSNGKVGMSRQHVENLIKNHLGKFVSEKISADNAKNTETANQAPETTKPVANSENEQIKNIKEKLANFSLDEERERWLNDRIGDIEYGGPDKGYEEGEKLRLYSMLLNDAERELEQFEALERERNEALEREKLEALERERHEAEAKEKLLNEVIENNRKILLSQIAENTRNMERANKATEEIKQGKKPKFSLLAWLTNLKLKKSQAGANRADDDAERRATDKSIYEEIDAKVKSELKDPVGTEQKEYHFWTSVGKEGANIMSDVEPLTEEKSKEFTAWYEKLDDDAKNRLMGSYRYAIGPTLKEWLNRQGANIEILPYDSSRMSGAKDMFQENVDYYTGLGETGLRLVISGTETPSEENTEQIKTWWRGLSRETKDRIMMNDLPAADRFRSWLYSQNLVRNGEPGWGWIYS